MATKTSMTTRNHAQTALAFLEHSDLEFESGDALQGSEKLWGAASHAISAIAKQRGWKHGKYKAKTEVVDIVAAEVGGRDSLLRAWDIAWLFHCNFYNDQMPDWKVERDRPLVHEFVRELVAMTGTSTSVHP